MDDLCGTPFEGWKEWLEGVWREMPRQFRSERTVHGTLACHVFWKLAATGLHVLAGWAPPRAPERAIDVIAVNDAGEIRYAVCLDTYVSLQSVKALSTFEGAEKLIVTTGPLERKVTESTFYLKPDIRHVHLPVAKPAL